MDLFTKIHVHNFEQHVNIQHEQQNVEISTTNYWLRDLVTSVLQQHVEIRNSMNRFVAASIDL